MRAFCCAALLATAACGSSTEPGKAGDPSLLFTNNLQTSYVYITWQDGQSIVGRDSVAPRTTSQCIRFLAQPDSAKWVITATENGGLASITTPYFDPAARPAWTVEVSSSGAVGSPQIIVKDVDIAC